MSSATEWACCTCLGLIPNAKATSYLIDISCLRQCMRYCWSNPLMCRLQHPCTSPHVIVISSNRCSHLALMHDISRNDRHYSSSSCSHAI